jgi:hypothetical protein
VGAGLTERRLILDYRRGYLDVPVRRCPTDPIHGVKPGQDAFVHPSISFSGDADMALPPHLEPDLAVLRRAYPHGLSDEDYLPLLAVLHSQFSDRNLAALVAELVDGEIVVVDNDAAAAAGYRRPPPAEIERVRQHLLANGYEEDDQDAP